MFMKAKKLVTLALPIMLLGGCGTVEKPSKEAKTESKSESKAEAKESSKDVQKVRVLAEDYPQYLIDLGNEFEASFKTLTTNINDSLDGKKSKQDILSSIDKANKVIAKFEAIDPPNKYVDTQKDIEKAVVKYKKSLSLLKDAYTRDKSNSNDKRTDKEIVEQAEQILHEGDKYWIAVYKEMKNEVTKSKGGGVESQDLKDSTTDAGVDYNAVKKNVLDGTELIANWGVTRDGKFNPLFILKGGSPKTFEVYTAGDYPNKTNYIEGTWEYDKSNMMLKLHISKQMANGVVAEVVHKDINYKVQNYDTKSLQLYNEDSKAITRYVKQK
ncbi:protein of unknown function [Bacillus sp. 491mf]|nr:DUF3994 domain-containing protein [Bacillus sp. UNC322MFChir4.1]SFC82112.1 protein of unknown function [Bacillus sp. 491mf]